MNHDQTISRLAHRLGTGYFVHTSILEVLDTVDLAQPIDWTKESQAFRKDGSFHRFAADHYFREAVADEATRLDLDRVWIAGALLQLGDALDRIEYYDRAPILELVRHLRNAVAHGNRFRINKAEVLDKFPAHNRDLRWHDGPAIEIVAALHDQPLMFDFMNPADFVDVFLAVAEYLRLCGM